MRFNKKGNLCEILDIEYPIIQAGMAGGATTVELVASVSETGALGTLGAAYMKTEDIKDAIRSIKKRTNRVFAVNLFCTSMEDDFSRMKEVQTVLNPFRVKLMVKNPDETKKTPDDFEKQFQMVIEENVPVISTAFGILPPDKMKLAKTRGVKVVTMVTTVQEAIIAERAGADVIVAQGSDAGGHRSTFDIKKHPNGANIGTFSLIPQVVDHVTIPVVAAGGIMDGRGMLAAMALGAEGIQMGTQFLTSKESGIHRLYKEALHKSTEESTVITKSFSGRPARGIKNEFISQYESSGVKPLPFPSQNTLTADIRKGAAEQNNTDYMSLWSGQGTRLLKADRTAECIIREVISEMEEVLRVLNGR
ncbi:NAD(P)H-dependent flavin oxidoreductase [Metabacillus sediminilitoris]|uniref:Probable nitronate monooxygenase n=1 Tax=Metabacillus sediminilitoris TaxID=2567941 RepID=A0A4S4C0V0_9BACI|nr:nitronate monooxygenase family protein [Metabacillus sediminilitoris]QGQ47793.1 nitronate monooxygenase [Metabacillus sediminilitoris]THF81094.1 nitronate monooxygenase [Metabacillus sediminilitoris]